MLASEDSRQDPFHVVDRPRRLRQDSHRHYDATGVGDKSLDLGGVLSVLKDYDGYEGGINCSICGKLYKSKVCFVKHIWEHTVYWDRVDAVKNQDRVLAIQAALILYAGNHGYPGEVSLSSLLVTAPHAPERRREGREEGGETSREVARPLQERGNQSRGTPDPPTPRKLPPMSHAAQLGWKNNVSPLKRKRPFRED